MILRNRKTFMNLFPYVFIMFLSLGIFAFAIGNGDELWNYNFARCIVEGKKPYSDFNMVPTPLSAYIAALILLVFGNNLLIFRIASIILMVVIFSLLYALCSTISGDREFSFTLTMIAFLLNFRGWIYNYNNLNLLLILIIMFLELKNTKKESDTKSCILIGFICGLVPLIKQSTGATVLMANAFICLIDYFIYKKNMFKLIIRGVFSVVPGVLFLLYLFMMGMFEDFYDYAVNGIRYFTHHISFSSYILSSPGAFLVGLFPIVVIIWSIVCFIKKEPYVSQRNHVIMLIFAIAGSIVSYPLCDNVHIAVAVVPFVPCLFCCIKKISFSDKGRKILVGAIAVVSTCLVIIQIMPNNGKYKKCELEHMFGLPISEELENNIEEVDNYIQSMNDSGVEVIIADKYAAFFSLPLDKYTKDFDLLLVGNVGTKSVEELLNRENVIYLVWRDDDTLGFQSHFQVIKHIKDNYKYIGEVWKFDAYEAGE